jgi:hypothetical protein
MGKDKSFLETWPEAILFKIEFLWLPFVAFVKIIQKIRKQEEEK